MDYPRFHDWLMAQPKKSAQEKRSHDIKLALNEREYQLTVARAQKVGKPLAVYCREVVMRFAPKIIPAINRQAWGQLGHHMSNINQLTRSLNEARLTSAALPDSLLIQLEEELLATQRLRLMLLGKEAWDDTQEN